MYNHSTGAIQSGQQAEDDIWEPTEYKPPEELGTMQTKGPPGYVYDSSSGYYYDAGTGYFYDPKTVGRATWEKYNAETFLQITI